MYTKIGPWGGDGGSSWDDEHIGGIRQILIQHGRAIDAIQIGYDVKGTLVLGDNHGGSGGSRTLINLNYPEEFLVGVSGTWGDLLHIPNVIRSLTFQTNKRTFGVSGTWGDLLHIPNVIRSLTFQTNNRAYGPYGEQQGKPFSYSAVGGKIVGFYGKSGILLDSIGVHCEPPKANSCLDLFLPTSCCDTNVCCQCSWSVFSCF